MQMRAESVPAHEDITIPNYLTETMIIFLCRTIPYLHGRLQIASGIEIKLQFQS